MIGANLYMSAHFIAGDWYGTVACCWVEPTISSSTGENSIIYGKMIVSIN